MGAAPYQFIKESHLITRLAQSFPCNLSHPPGKTGRAGCFQKKQAWVYSGGREVLGGRKISSKARVRVEIHLQAVHSMGPLRAPVALYGEIGETPRVRSEVREVCSFNNF